MKHIAVAVATLNLVAAGPASAQGSDTLRAVRTGPGGANQAAGPGGQHPGQVGIIPLTKAAVFDIQLANLAAVPPVPADKSRLPRLSAALRKELALQNVFEIVPISPAVAAEAAKSPSLRTCNGCAVDFARRLGAQVAVTADLQKVSAAVSNLNVYVKSVGGKAPEASFTANVRGDDDGSLDHAVKYVVDEVIVPKMAQAGRR